jgi:hypothetical protein
MSSELIDCAIDMEIIDCSSLDVDSICKRFTKHPVHALAAYQVLNDQIAKNQGDLFSFVDGEAWGRPQYFVVAVGQNNKFHGSASAGNDGSDADGLRVRVYIPISANETIDMAWLVEVVRAMGNQHENVEVYAAMYEAADNIM